MRIVFMSNMEIEHHHIISSIDDEFSIDKIIHPVYSSAGSEKSFLNTWGTSRIFSIKNFFNRIYYRSKLKRDQYNSFKKIFITPVAEQCKIIDIRRSKINSQYGIELISSLSPDLIIVSGAPILSKKLFSLPGVKVINVHFGIAPFYRGNDTVFWPLYYRDYNKIGVTIHYINDGIDRGPIIARAYPEIEPGDSEFSLYLKCSRMAAHLLSEIIRAMGKGKVIKGIPQDKKGSLYSWRGRTSVKNIEYWFRRVIKKERPPYLAEIKELFF
ncbi:formyl transferase [Spirochaetota bacterium]